MGLTKTSCYTSYQNKIAQLAKILGHPARIAILQQVAKSNGCVCGDLVDEIGLAQATISQHLKELKNSGIIQGTIEGTSVCYCIDIKKWNEVKIILDSFLTLPKTISKSCC